jgi:paraquat-inducible protein B
MKQQAHTFKIGVFVIVGLGIALAAVVLIGSGRLFARVVPMIVYFESSVNGLSVGAPVKFKGVPVGQVRSIHIAYDEQRIRQYIPVLLELDEGRVITATGRQLDLNDREFMQAQVDIGFRASLQLESFISGRLFVQLDYLEYAAEPRYLHTGPYFEVPAVATGLPEFMESLSRTDLAGMAIDLRTLLRALNRMIQDLEVVTIREELVNTLSALRSTMHSPGLTNLVQSVNLAADQLQQFLQATRPEVSRLSDDLSSFTHESALTLAELRRALEDIQRVLGPNSVPLAQVQETLRDLGDAAQSVRRVADTLQRTPSVLITGRPPDIETDHHHPNQP